MDTINQSNADDFDLSIFRLVRQAEQYAENSTLLEDEQLKWLRTATKLKKARRDVRAMMSDLRRQETSGR